MVMVMIKVNGKVNGKVKFKVTVNDLCQIYIGQGQISRSRSNSLVNVKYLGQGQFLGYGQISRSRSSI